MDGALEVPSLCWALLTQPGEEAATIANSSTEELASSMVYHGSKGGSREKPTTNTPSARRVGHMRSAMAFADKCRAELQIRRDGLQVAP